MKAGLTSGAAQDRLQDLLRAHRYVEGLAFVPQDPDQQHGDEASGYSSLEAG